MDEYTKTPSTAPPEETEALLWRLYAGIDPPDRSVPYYSCKWIESGLVFLSDKLTACCVSADGENVPVLAEYSGGDLPLEDVLKRRKELIQSSRDAGPTECRGCAFLEKKQWPALPYFFDHLVITHFSTCNLACTYCYFAGLDMVSRKQDSVYPLLPVMQKLHEETLLGPDLLVSWGGGEPTILNEFEALFSFFTTIGAQAHICTNAVLLSPVIIQALQQDRASLLISLDAGTRETYNGIKQRDKFESVLDNIREYVHAGKFHVTVKFIILPENIRDIGRFTGRMAELGVKRVCLDVNANIHETDPEILEAAAVLKHGCEGRGISTVFGDFGVPLGPGKVFEQQVEEHLGRLRMFLKSPQHRNVFTPQTELKVTVLPDANVVSVLAAVRPPYCYTKESAKKVLPAQLVDLTQETPSLFSANIDGLRESGTYDLDLWAEDAEGFLSFPAYTRLRKRDILTDERHTGWWYNPAEPGTGIALEIRDKRIMAAWFGYSASGRPVWFMGIGQKKDQGIFTVPLHRYSGPGPQEAASTFNTRLLGRMGLSFLANDVCKMDMRSPVAVDTNLVHYMDDLSFGDKDPRDIHGWWHSPAHPGVLFFLQVQAETFFGACFYFGTEGAPRWANLGGYEHVGRFPCLAEEFSAEFNEYSQGAVLGGPWQPARESTTGPGRFTLHPDGTARLHWNDLSIDLTRHDFAAHSDRL